MTQEEFDKLKQSYSDNYSHLSLIKRDSEEFKQIIDAGEEALPYLFIELLKTNLQPWFFSAIAVITKENPVKPKNKGNLEYMQLDWIKWALENDYIKVYT